MESSAVSEGKMRQDRWREIQKILIRNEIFPIQLSAAEPALMDVRCAPLLPAKATCSREREGMQEKKIKRQTGCCLSGMDRFPVTEAQG